MEFNTISDLKYTLSTPSSAYRSAPFWAWNDQLEKEELKVQIQGMKEQGMGGFFIHSREGLETEYLSQEWMEATQIALQEAQNEGMKAWIYDENKWPSGSCGGLVSAGGKEYTAKGLTLEVLTLQEEIVSRKSEIESSETLALFTIKKEQNKISYLHQCTQLPVLEEGEKLLIFRVEISGNSEWYNGYAPSDNLSSESTKRFIQLTHEKYKEQIPQELFKSVQGFFTDEPNFADFSATFTPGRPWLPWTEDLGAYFTTKRGYSMIPYLPYLFFDGEMGTKVRHDYWRTLTEKFSECYVKPLYEWCEINGMKMAGHYLFENDMGYVTRVCGTPMPHYRYMHAPGIDILGEQTKEYLTVKQCTSVANQFDREEVVSETYGCTGWEFTFEGQKWLADWQYVMGVNVRCQHLAFYSIKGCRKRDYPPSFNYNTSWWQYNKVMEDYFARVGACTRVGKVQRNILVIHPASTLWTLSRSDEQENLKDHFDDNMGWTDEHIVSLNRKGEEYARFTQMLLSHHYDFDFGDETILEEYGKVKAVEGTIKSIALQVNKVSYTTVIVPQVATLFASTVALLEEYLTRGGKILWVKPFPTMIEGEENIQIQRLLVHKNLVMVENDEEILSQLEIVGKREVSIKSIKGNEATSILAMTRKTEDGYILFVINNDRHNSYEVQMRLAFKGKVEIYDPLTDRTKEQKVALKDEKMTFITTFKASESKIYFIHTQEEPSLDQINFNYIHPHRGEEVLSCLGPVAHFTRTMPNILTLDTCCYQMEQGAWSDEMPVWKAQQKIREVLKLQQIYYNGAPQRYGWIHENCETDGKEVGFKFQFEILELPQNSVYIGIEEAKYFSISCNGLVCSKEAEGYLLDKSIDTVPLEGLKIGMNEIILNCKYLNEMEMEDIYLVGEFGVSNDRKIINEPDKLHFGDWCFQGYPHYAGSMVYHFDIQYKVKMNKQAILRIGEYKGVLCTVSVNGHTVAYVPWASADQVDLTAYFKEGTNQIDLEVVGTPRNMFGPFHQKYTDCSRISWADFRTEGELYTPDYVLEPYGLYHQACIYYTEIE